MSRMGLIMGVISLLLGFALVYMMGIMHVI